MVKVILSVVKLIFTILVFPLLYASAVSLIGHMGGYPNEFEDFFSWGVLTFLLIFLFFYQFWSVYEFGQKIMGGLLKFMAPLDRYIAAIIPLYFILVMMIFYVIKSFLGLNNYDHYFLFFAGFTFCMHILLTAQDLQEQEKAVVKTTYLFWMNIILIANAMILVLFMDLNLGQFTFPKYFDTLMGQSQAIYAMIWDMITSVKLTYGS